MTAMSLLRLQRIYHLIPSFFPVTPSSQTTNDWVDDDSVRTFYFVFSLSKTVGTDILTDGQLADVGFLPKRLSDSLVCKALAWCREISYCDTELNVAGNAATIYSMVVTELDQRWKSIHRLYRVHANPNTACNFVHSIPKYWISAYHLTERATVIYLTLW
jgi:hypothetical protein